MVRLHAPALLPDRWSAFDLVSSFGVVPAPERAPPRPAPANFVAETHRIDSALEALGEAGADDRDTWINTGLSLHHGSNGSAKGFALWDVWSALSGQQRAPARPARQSWK